jgi:8-oxo-dGTP diphosphatase
MTERIDVVKLLIENEDGEFLMLKKSSDYDWMAEKWEQPKGKIEDGEDRFDAAKREVKEETDLDLESVEDLIRLEIEDEKLINCYVMYTEEFSGEVNIDQEHQDFQWVSREDAIELDWHRDASYILPVIQNLEVYRDEKDYGKKKNLE